MLSCPIFSTTPFWPDSRVTSLMNGRVADGSLRNKRWEFLLSMIWQVELNWLLIKYVSLLKFLPRDIIEAIIDILIIIQLLLKMSSLAQFFEARNASSAGNKPIVANQLITQVFQSKKQQPLSKPTKIENAPLKKKKEKIAKPQKIQQEAPALQQPKKEEPEDLQATIFVGNVPLSSTHKSIKLFFNKYGTILKVWFRSIPVEQGKVPRKAKHIQKKYKEGADSMNAYVKFQDKKEAKAACEANGSMIEDKNIKVTMCNDADVDFQTTIFIGNLPTQVKDQQIWDAFNHLGTIKSVRVVRNAVTMDGIGIAFVKFEDKEEMKRAIEEMNGKKLGDRQMRIKKAVSKERRDKKIKKVEQKKQNKMKGIHTAKNNQNKGEMTGKGIKSREKNEEGMKKVFNQRPNKSNQGQSGFSERPRFNKTKNISKQPKFDRPSKPFNKKQHKNQYNNQRNNQTRLNNQTRFGDKKPFNKMNENGGPNPDFLNIKGAKEMKNNKKILL